MASEKNIRNSRFFCVTDPSRLDAEISGFAGNVDFIYSLLVFQHIDDFRVIAAYIQAISSLLSKDGIAYLQFDTRDQTALYRVKNALPDFVLPRFLRRGIRRIRRTPAELEDAFARSSLEAIDSISPNTEYHRYVLCRRDATS
jgi:cyclopropane fatty-acyl-phospholipid synthase-like methyltransferase